MSDLVQQGDAIEGDAIEGQSRKPLKNYGLDLFGEDTRCFRYGATFDVKAKVTKELAAGTAFMFGAAGSRSGADEIICETATILTLDKRPSTTVTMGSATHQTNKWTFTERTRVVVESPHQSLVNAIEKRKAAELEGAKKKELAEAKKAKRK